MKKFTSVLALLLCVLMVFASCGSSEKPLKLDNEVLNKSRVATNFTSTELTSIGEGYTFLNRKNDLALFSKVFTDTSSTNFKIVNLKTNAVVIDKTIAATDIATGNTSVSLSTSGSFIVIYEDKTYTLYKSDGVTAIGSAKTAPVYVNDCAVIGDTVCRYDTNTYEVKEIFTYPSLNGELPVSTGYVFSDYYVSKTPNGFTVYDKHYKLIGEYSLPEYASAPTVSTLKNGNVFVQYKVGLPFDAKEYDLFFDGEKFDLVQKIISAKDLSEKEISLDYYVTVVSPVNADAEGYLFKKDIDNIAYCYKIENKQYDVNNALTVGFSNSGKTQLVFDERYNTYSPIGNGYLSAITKNGMKVILDSKLNVVSQAESVVSITEKYILTTSAIYDFNFAKLADLSTDSLTYSFEDTVGNNLIFSALDETLNEDYFIFDGAFTKIVDASEKQSFRGIYGSSLYAVSTTVDTVTTTRIYKADKTEFASYTDAVSFVNVSPTLSSDLSFVVKVGLKYFYISEAAATT